MAVRADFILQNSNRGLSFGHSMWRHRSKKFSVPDKLDVIWTVANHRQCGGRSEYDVKPVGVCNIPINEIVRDYDFGIDCPRVSHFMSPLTNRNGLCGLPFAAFLGL